VDPHGLEPLMGPKKGLLCGLMVQRLDEASTSPTGLLDSPATVEVLVKTVCRSERTPVDGTISIADIVNGLSLSTRVQLGRNLAPLHAKVLTSCEVWLCLFCSYLQCVLDTAMPRKGNVH
jgi:hypothetical protein